MNKWYLYENEEVVGPFEPAELSERIDADTLVCRAGEEEWNPAGGVPDLEPVLREDEQPEPEPAERGTEDQSGEWSSEETTEEEIIEPTLENLHEICEKAADRDLLEEHENHLDDYDEEERRLIREELERRGLSDRVE